MPKLVRNRTLETLRADAEAVPGLRARVREVLASAGEYYARAERAEASASAAQVAAAEAQTRAQRAVAGYEAVRQDALYRATQVLEATRSPERGEEIRGALALRLMRQELADVREHGDPEQIKAIHIYEALLGEPEESARPEGQEVPATAPGHDAD